MKKKDRIAIVLMVWGLWLIMSGYLLEIKYIHWTGALFIGLGTGLVLFWNDKDDR